MIDQEKIRKRKMKETFEWNQVEFLMNLELVTGLVLKRGDKLTLMPDKNARKAIITRLLRSEDNIVKGKEEEFFEITTSVEEGEFQAIAHDTIYKGLEMYIKCGSSGTIVLPLLLVNTINGIEVDWDALAQNNPL